MRLGAPEKNSEKYKTENYVACENALSIRGKATEIIKWLQSKKNNHEVFKGVEEYKSASRNIGL